MDYRSARATGTNSAPPNSSEGHTSPVPVLAQRQAFETALKQYSVHPDALAILRQTPFVLLSAASASGRNTIINRLLERYGAHYYFVVTDTTRPIRIKNGVPIEKDGVDYFFRPEDDILADLQNGQFIEAAIIHNQQVSGISIREIEKANSNGKIAITDVTLGGFQTIAGLKPDTIGIFVLPPSFEEWLARIARRSNLTNEEVKNRLESGVTEFEQALKDDRFIFVINDQLEDAVQTVDEIARQGLHHKREEAKAHKLAEKLRAETIAYLASYPNW